MNKMNEFLENILSNLDEETLKEILTNPDMDLEELESKLDEKTIMKSLLVTSFDLNYSDVNIKKTYKDYLNDLSKERLKETYIAFLTFNKNMTIDEKKEKKEMLLKNKISRKKIVDDIYNNYQIYVEKIFDNLTEVTYLTIPEILDNLDEDGYWRFNIDEDKIIYSVTIGTLCKLSILFANTDNKDNYIEIHIPKEILEIINSKVNNKIESIIESNDILFNTLISLSKVYGIFKFKDIKELTNVFDNYTPEDAKDKAIFLGLITPLYKVNIVNNEFVVHSIDIDCERDEDFINEILDSKLPYKKYSDKELEKYIDDTYYTSLKEYKKVYKIIKKQTDEESAKYAMEVFLPTFISLYQIDEDLAYEFLEDEEFEDFFEDFSSIALKCPNWNLKGDLIK